MKGPGLKTRLDVRRVWKCPQTGRILKTPGHVTQFVSPFTKDRCWMQFIETEHPPRPMVPLDEMLSHMYFSATEEDVVLEESVGQEIATENSTTKEDCSAPESESTDVDGDVAPEESQ
ncbi:MAG TPA: hypothetical protein DD473_21930 [Planctomycetaceae bacterium]|nr:hypothetical protein [Planctomycetaceae bacterium]|tara:strand:- start:942 stop:1295 length:354 start_codon:yes stop_codon:yes gene_type:complete